MRRLRSNLPPLACISLRPPGRGWLNCTPMTTVHPCCTPSVLRCARGSPQADARRRHGDQAGRVKCPKRHGLHARTQTKLGRPGGIHDRSPIRAGGHRAATSIPAAGRGVVVAGAMGRASGHGNACGGSRRHLGYRAGAQAAAWPARLAAHPGAGDGLCECCRCISSSQCRPGLQRGSWRTVSCPSCGCARHGRHPAFRPWRRPWRLARTDACVAYCTSQADLAGDGGCARCV